MFGLFKKKETPEEARALALYELAVKQARIPSFYEDCNVPDSVDGRFEMICLHAGLLIMRLEQLGEAGAKLAQALFDHMFLDMDRSLREMGISDLRVPKHMKRMLNGFNGRAQAYKEAILANDRKKLEAAILRNIYGTIDDADERDISHMADYTQRQWRHVQMRGLQDFQNAENIFMKEGET
mgnify:CR=1 FL=1